ncbi:hypothetical protein [Xenorhabdus sp. PB30.3]|uniref:hypothetical protein n=1 Tax=Xenorhabdus sp. PB30.3 TaxID=2788941 RepID=UPI001E508C16|nr:hypothetical protein [Xenorhabdus sp. PB30.3]MCC8379140.1 hypothetical protein [Xenorhabdus sp. PB30.3]
MNSTNFSPTRNSAFCNVPDVINTGIDFTATVGFAFAVRADIGGTQPDIAGQRFAVDGAPAGDGVQGFVTGFR